MTNFDLKKISRFFFLAFSHYLKKKQFIQKSNPQFIKAYG